MSHFALKTLNRKKLSWCNVHWRYLNVLQFYSFALCEFCTLFKLQISADLAVPVTIIVQMAQCVKWISLETAY